VPRKTVLQYLRDFSKANGLDEVIRYNARVSRVSRTLEGSWKTEVETLKRDPQHQRIAMEHAEEVRTQIFTSKFGTFLTIIAGF